jgi:hypothetical protein
MAEHDVETLAQSVNAFGFGLFRTLPQAGYGFFFPVSIVTTLAAAPPARGARSPTTS